MNRKDTERKIRKVLFIIFASIIVIEAILLYFGMSHNTMELLTVSFSFPQMMGIVLLIDLPLFIFVAVITDAIKEINLYRNSYNKDKTRLRLASSSAVLSILTAMLFFATNNTTSATLNDALFLSTLVFALATVIVFAIYLIKNRK